MKRNSIFEVRLCSSGHTYNIYVGNKYLGLPEHVARLYRVSRIDSDFSDITGTGIPLIAFSSEHQRYYCWDTLNLRQFKYSSYGIGDTVKFGDIGYYLSNLEDVRNICDNYVYDGSCMDLYLRRTDEDYPKLCNEELCPFGVGRGEFTAYTLQDAKQMAVDWVTKTLGIKRINIGEL